MLDELDRLTIRTWIEAGTSPDALLQDYRYCRSVCAVLVNGGSLPDLITHSTTPEHLQVLIAVARRLRRDHITQGSP